MSKKNLLDNPQRGDQIMSKKVKDELIDEGIEETAAETMRRTLGEAKATLHAFKLTDVFKDLADDVKTAIERLSKKASTAGGRSSSTHNQLKELFPEIGVAIDEFEIFKATKMGRAELKKKVFYAMKQCDPSEKQWIRFDAPLESWIKDAVGPDMPDNWTEDMLPRTRAASV